MSELFAHWVLGRGMAKDRHATQQPPNTQRNATHAQPRQHKHAHQHGKQHPTDMPPPNKPPPVFNTLPLYFLGPPPPLYFFNTPSPYFQKYPPQKKRGWGFTPALKHMQVKHNSSFYSMSQSSLFVKSEMVELI